VPKVRLIDANGEQMGIVNRDEALDQAAEAELDLVEVAPNSDPPVCRIMDYGKYKFEQQKRESLQKKKQKQIHVKEVKLRPRTDEGDYQVKLRNIRKFIEQGNKVKISIRFRGREMAHQELGANIMKRIQQDLGEQASVEKEAKLEGKQMLMVVGPPSKPKK